MPHNFSRSLALSHQYENAPWWPIVYKRAFPGFQDMVSVRQDGWAQRAGIDRQVILASSKVIKIDEKVRSEDWPDFLLERWSDRHRKIPGWIQKDLDTDFLAYAFIPSQRCYLLPFLLLRNAWRLEGKSWIYLAENRLRGFGVILADNEEHGRTWQTESIAVPIDILLATIRQAMIVSWGDDQPTVLIQNTNVNVSVTVSPKAETPIAWTSDEPELPL